MADKAKIGEDEVKYVYLELIKPASGDKYDVIAGLLKMLFKKDGDTYICVHGIKNSTTLLNLKYYNIMTIEYLDSNFKHMAIATQNTDDQKEAFGMVEDLFKKLCAGGFGAGKESICGIDVEMLDVTKYSGYPEEYMEGAKVEKDKLSTTDTTIQKAPYQRYARGTTTSNFVKTPVKPDPEPALFSRTKTEKPTAESLGAIREKINGVKAGTYTPEFPVTLVGDESADEYEEYDYRQGHYFCGGMC